MSLEKELIEIGKIKIDVLKRVNLKVQETKAYLKVFPEKRPFLCRQMHVLVKVALEVFEALEGKQK